MDKPHVFKAGDSAVVKIRRIEGNMAVVEGAGGWTCQVLAEALKPMPGSELHANVENAEIVALKATVEELKKSLYDARQIGAHATAEVIARKNAMITGRLLPLLEDAADALSREPLYIDIAIERIRSVRYILKGEISL